jgi:hypothetical protein
MRYITEQQEHRGSRKLFPIRMLLINNMMYNFPPACEEEDVRKPNCIWQLNSEHWGTQVLFT